MAKSAHVTRLSARVAQTAARFVDQAAQTGATVPDLLSMKLPWYTIQNAAADKPDEVPTVLIFDEIGGSFGVNAEQFALDLQEIDAPAITVRINSPGGSLFDGIAIYNALNHHPAQITVYIDALAASAASIIAMAGDEIVMMPGSQMMIHDASAVEDGNAADMSKMATLLDRQSDNIADIYRMRGGGDLAGWRDLMLEETWMFSREAVSMKLADRVEEPAKPELESAGIADRMTRSFDLSRYRYEGRAAAPEPGQTRTVKPPVRRAVPSGRAPEGAADKSTRAKSGGVERRSYPVQLEVRSGRSVDTTVVEGYASVTESPYDMWDQFGQYTEVIRSGAFTRTLNGNPQVQLLLNHAGLSMAYTRAGTLQLSEDSTGLHMRAEVNPARSDVSDMLIALDDGAIDEMSFAFRVPDGRSIWSPDYDQRDITEVDMNRGDVAVVNFGASSTTTVGIQRALQAQDLDHMDERAARAMFDRLNKRFMVQVPDLGALAQRAAVVAPPAESQPDDVPGDGSKACASCEDTNAVDAKFCNACGASLTAVKGDGDTKPVDERSTEARRPLALSLREQAADDDARIRALAI